MRERASRKKRRSSERGKDAPLDRCLFSLIFRSRRSRTWGHVVLGARRLLELEPRLDGADDRGHFERERQSVSRKKFSPFFLFFLSSSFGDRRVMRSKRSFKNKKSVEVKSAVAFVHTETIPRSVFFFSDRAHALTGHSWSQ